ncbi:PREDICTED: HSPB1-associated protein 1 [Vollenhovia emeryi]|uniref:HSPB1-associated protein 1 n=1 Tax=Vollenhovia emeryi TaxID=411798 RepID=UPI0005F4B64A|nr:PREDICTED: HSPB1-associated protein 1 [Vollenhovia emeryi]
MSRPLKPLDEELQNILPKLDEPVLFQNMLITPDGVRTWKLLQWSLDELVEKFGEKKLPFRVGNHNKRTCVLQHQQWCVSPPPEPVQLTLQEFLTLETNRHTWHYCDYKHIKEWFGDNKEIVESFNWLKFGMDKELGKNGMHSTIWIGNKGAHTDCHRDTYGYNLVAQIHGRKQWLLYPPGASLIPVRLPYEESTVYSRYNLFCLSEEEKEYLLDISDKPKLITLEPGDVLFVPNGWWHYVESLDDVTVSVNMWGKLKADNRARLEEALVKLIIGKMGDYKQEYEFPSRHITSYTTLVERAVECIEKERQEKAKSTSGHKSFEKRLKPTKRPQPQLQTASELAEEYPFYVKALPDADKSEFEEFLEEKRKRDREKYPSEETSASGDFVPNPQYDSFFESIINALCHPEVISKAAEVLLERHY